MRKINPLFNLITFCSLALACFLSFISPSFSSDVSYGLPEEIDSKTLTKNAVFIACGGNRGTGFAIGEKHIITSAHNLGPHYFHGESIKCAFLTSVNSAYVVPVESSRFQTGVYENFDPVFQGAENLQVVEIVKAHFHPQTKIEKFTDVSKSLTYDELLKTLNEVLKFGLEDAKKYSSNGVMAYLFDLNEQGKFFEQSFKVFGPDIAILECKEPHGLPTLEIASPTQERSLLYVIGLNGVRYKNDDSSQTTAGVVCPVDDGQKKYIAYVFKPAIYAQRFTCLPASTDENWLWFNRVFLKTINKRFLIDDQVYPNAPKGFGLLAAGDSGSGAVLIKDGKAFLAGIARAGCVSPTFISIQNFLEGKGYLNGPVNPRAVNPVLYEIYKIYMEALTTQDRNKKWFISQSLEDVTHRKDWIDSILNGLN